jgi:hypothetical protein
MVLLGGYGLGCGGLLGYGGLGLGYSGLGLGSFNYLENELNINVFNIKNYLFFRLVSLSICFPSRTWLLVI